MYGLCNQAHWIQMIKEKIVIYPETKYQLPVVQQHVQPYYGYTKTTVTPYELEQEIKKAQKLNIDIGNSGVTIKLINP